MGGLELLLARSSLDLMIVAGASIAALRNTHRFFSTRTRKQPSLARSNVLETVYEASALREKKSIYFLTFLQRPRGEHTEKEARTYNRPCSQCAYATLRTLPPVLRQRPLAALVEIIDAYGPTASPLLYGHVPFSPSLSVL